MVFEEYKGNCHYVLYGAISTLTIVTSGVKWLGHDADFSPPVRAEEPCFYSAMSFRDAELNWYWMQFVGAFAVKFWKVTASFCLSIHLSA
jgi:hypothetical protein